MQNVCVWDSTKRVSEIGVDLSYVLSRKLAMTAALLGCGTRKELCSRFREVNPATEFDLERSFKWLQARALPKSATVYDDWAKVLKSNRPGSWFAACSSAAFVEEFCEIFAAERKDIERSADKFLGLKNVALQNADGVVGHFVSYCWALSASKHGHLVRGYVTLDPGKSGALAVTYLEFIEGEQVSLAGSAHRAGRLLYATLSGHHDDFLQFSLVLPGRPIKFLCGHISGSPMADLGHSIATSRVVMIKLPKSDISTPTVFVRPTAEHLSADLGLHGVTEAGETALADAMLQFLNDSQNDRPSSVSSLDMSVLLQAIDRAP